MSYPTSYDSSNDIIMNGSVILFTSFAGGVISFIGCSLIYKRIKEQYRQIERNSYKSKQIKNSIKFTFETDEDFESDKKQTLPGYDNYIQSWVIDRNHNHHKGSDKYIPFEFVEDLTSNGLVYMTYSKEQKRFYYWSNNTVNYNILCVVARKYCITYGCVDYYLDGYEESKSDEEDESETHEEIHNNEKDSETDEDDYLFLKPKSIEKEIENTLSPKENRMEISEEEEEDEYIEERYGRYGDMRKTTPVPKHLIFINKGNIYEWEDIRKKEEKKQQMNKWKNAMMDIGEEDNDDNHLKNDHMCNSYAEFKDMIQAEKKLLDVEGSVVHLKTPSPSPVHLNSSDTYSE